MPRVKPNKYDQMFSRWIRTRDDWTCQRCGGQYEPPTRALHNSHYYRRGIHATRFDPDNCIALCYGCHALLEGDKQGAYMELMVDRLGRASFGELALRSGTTVKKRIAEQEAFEWLKEGL